MQPQALQGKQLGTLGLAPLAGLLAERHCGAFDAHFFFLEPHRDQQIIEARGKRFEQRFVYFGVNRNHAAGQHDDRRRK